MKQICEYKKVEANIPFPRILYHGACGYQLCIIDGYKRGEAGEILSELNHPTGTCSKCKQRIHVLEDADGR